MRQKAHPGVNGDTTGMQCADKSLWKEQETFYKMKLALFFYIKVFTYIYI